LSSPFLENLKRVSLIGSPATTCDAVPESTDHAAVATPSAPVTTVAVAAPFTCPFPVVTLLTRDGRIRLELRMTGMQPDAFGRFEDALVRVRGCLLATWDYVTHQVTVGGVRIYGAEVSMDDPPAADLFSIPSKTAAELLLFDPQAGLFQRVKVSGQVVHVDGSVGYLMDGRNGLRFVMKKESELQTGDLIEVVGFPELSGASPILREAVARKISHAPLPRPTQLLATNVLRVDVDATRVRVEGVLTGVRESGMGEVLEIQSGVRTFAARLAGRDGRLRSLPIGSRLELTGVYAAQGGKLAGQAITSFELLLDTFDDVKVLARPPWWTLERLLIVVGALAFVLAPIARAAPASRRPRSCSRTSTPTRTTSSASRSSACWRP